MSEELKALEAERAELTAKNDAATEARLMETPCNYIGPCGWKDERPSDRPADVRYVRADLASGLVQDEWGWRDISTAPKDGTGFLFYQPVIGGRRIIDAGYFDGDLFRAVDFYQTDDPVVEPTHWMPLPTPPIRSARDGGAES